MHTLINKYVVRSIITTFAIAINYYVAAQDVELQAQLPFDKTIRTGILRNGFTYFLKYNDDDATFAEFVVKAGTTDEDSDQAEIAHVLEHMAFKGTKHFPDPKRFFEMKGIPFGPNMNASTGDKSTKYYMTLPSNSKDLLLDVLRFYRDCAHEMLLREEDINIERGAILSELRKGDSPMTEMQRVVREKLMGDSPFSKNAYRDTRENVKSFHPKVLRKFYNEYYRPDLQGIIIVGRIDIDSVLQSIDTLFSNLKRPKAKIKAKITEVDFNWCNQYIPITDENFKDFYVEIYIKHPHRITKTYGDLKRELAVELLNDLFSERFSAENQLRSDGSKAFLKINNPFTVPGPDFDAVVGNIRLEESQLESGFIFAMKSIERIRRFGFSAAEVNIIKSRYRDNTKFSPDDGSYAIGKSIEWYFTHGYHFPQDKNKSQVIDNLFNSIDSVYLNNTCQEFLKIDNNLDVVLYAPRQKKEMLPNENDIVRWSAEARSSTLTHSVSATRRTTILPESVDDSLENSGSSKITLSKYITKISLPNGIQVYLNSNRSLTGKAAIHGFKPVGIFDAARTSNYASVYYAPHLVMQSDIKGVSASDARIIRRNSGISNFQYYINEDYSGFTAEFNENNFIEVLKTIYSYSTDPQIDNEVVRKMIREAKDRSTKESSYYNVFFDTIIANRTNRHTIHKVSTKELESFDPGKSLRTFKKLFSNADGFTIVISGAFDEDSVTKALEKYIGNIPLETSVKDGQNEAAPFQRPRAKMRKTVYYSATSTDRSDVSIYLDGEFNYDFNTNIRLEMLKRVLQSKLFNRLREKEGGIYSVDVSLYTSKRESSTYSFNISFTCSMGNLNQMIASTYDEIKKIKTELTDQGLLDAVKHIAIEDHRKEIATFDFWNNYIVQQLKYDEDISSIGRKMESIEAFSVYDLRNTANQYLNEGNAAEFVLVPLNSEP